MNNNTDKPQNHNNAKRWVLLFKKGLLWYFRYGEEVPLLSLLY